MGYRQFNEQSKQGHLLLLNYSPQAPPLLMKDNSALGSTAWGLNTHVSNNIEPAAQKALLARTQMSGGTSQVALKAKVFIPLWRCPLTPLSGLSLMIQVSRHR